MMPSASIDGAAGLSPRAIDAGFRMTAVTDVADPIEVDPWFVYMEYET
ncbi:hypothetical protein P6F26_05360 [Roseibacterium sp. SDUM158017]|nr:hypothetical protein [Roseibacterium sp. SDUM158017]MDG4647863.1 hypothetical protein [Roseibacterium sp. SDUM158017]